MILRVRILRAVISSLNVNDGAAAFSDLLPGVGSHATVCQDSCVPAALHEYNYGSGLVKYTKVGTDDTINGMTELYRAICCMRRK